MAEEGNRRDVYSVWALPDDDAADRFRRLMDGLRSEFSGPKFHPHVTIVGAVNLTAEDALKMFASAREGLQPYTAVVDRVASGTFFYQCVYLLLRQTPEVMAAGAHCQNHFNYQSSTAYMPHLSLVYADLSDEDKKKAVEKACVLDGGLDGLDFKISRIGLFKTDTEDKTLESWEKVAEYKLGIHD